MSEQKSEEEYNSTETTPIQIPDKVSKLEGQMKEQRVYGRESAKKIEQNRVNIETMKDNVHDIKTAMEVKETDDENRHKATLSSLDRNKKSVDKLSKQITDDKSEASDKENEDLKEKLTEYEEGKKDNRKIIIAIFTAALILILTRHLGTIVKIFSGG